MTATVILDEIRRLGFGVRAEGERLVVRDVDRLPDDLRALLREQRTEVLDLLRREAAGADRGRSDLVRRYRGALDWLVEHCPENFAALKAEDDRGADPERMRSIMAAGLTEYDRAHGLKTLRIYSRVLDTEAWLVPDDETAADLGAELATEGDTRAVWTYAEVLACKRMLEEDIRTIARVKRAIPGAALRSVESRGGERLRGIVGDTR